MKKQSNKKILHKIALLSKHSEKLSSANTNYKKIPISEGYFIKFVIESINRTVKRDTRAGDIVEIIIFCREGVREAKKKNEKKNENTSIAYETSRRNSQIFRIRGKGLVEDLNNINFSLRLGLSRR